MFAVDADVDRVASTIAIRAIGPRDYPRAVTQLARIENKLIDDGLVMKLSTESARAVKTVREFSNTVPHSFRGFDLKIVKCSDYDPEHSRSAVRAEPVRATIVSSLACLDVCTNLPEEISKTRDLDDCSQREYCALPPSFVERYSSKLSLMCVNVARLVYTTEAFRFHARKLRVFELLQQTAGTDAGDLGSGRRTKTRRDESFRALNFYLKTDTNYAHASFDRKPNAGVEPNVQFSELLHRLRSTGYAEYVVALARHLNFDLELLTDRNRAVVYSYKNNAASDSPVLGVLTAYHDASRWYVYVSDTSPSREYDADLRTVF